VTGLSSSAGSGSTSSNPLAPVTNLVTGLLGGVAGK